MPIKKQHLPTRGEVPRKAGRRGGGTSTPVPAISPAEYSRRRQAVAAGLDAAGLDAMCVFYPARVAYLTGFHHIPTERPIALVLDSKANAVLIVPAVEKEHAESSTSLERIDVY